MQVGGEVCVCMMDCVWCAGWTVCEVCVCGVQGGGDAVCRVFCM